MMNRQASLENLDQVAVKMAGFMNQHGLDGGQVEKRAKTMSHFSSREGTVFMKGGSIAGPSKDKTNQKWRWSWPF